MGSTSSSGIKHLCRQAGQPGEGLAWERDDYLQSTEEVVEQDGKQGLQGNVDKREIPFKGKKKAFLL